MDFIRRLTVTINVSMASTTDFIRLVERMEVTVVVCLMMGFVSVLLTLDSAGTDGQAVILTRNVLIVTQYHLYSLYLGISTGLRHATTREYSDINPEYSNTRTCERVSSHCLVGLVRQNE